MINSASQCSITKCKTQGVHCICNGASCTTRNPSGHRYYSRQTEKKSSQKSIKLYVLYQKTQCLYNHSECPFQMGNLVISQQLGKWQRTQGFIKKNVCRTKLGSVSDETVCLCCAMPCVQHPILLCARGLQQICVYGCCAVVDSAKNPRERGRQTLKGEKETKRDRKRDKERQRRAVTSDAVCPHLISACFQPS